MYDDNYSENLVSKTRLKGLAFLNSEKLFLSFLKSFLFISSTTKYTSCVNPLISTKSLMIGKLWKWSCKSGKDNFLLSPFIAENMIVSTAQLDARTPGEENWCGKKCLAWHISTSGIKLGLKKYELFEMWLYQHRV